MNAALENLMTRRSVRAFTAEPVSPAELDQLAAAGMRAPCAMNRHTRQFTFVRNKELIARLGRAAARAAGREDCDFYRPDVIILVSDRRENRLAVEDCACGMMNLLNAAHALGLGGVWINILRGVCDQPEVRALLDTLGVPTDHCVWGTAAIGHAAPAEPRPRPEDRVVMG